MSINAQIQTSSIIAQNVEFVTPKISNTFYKLTMEEVLSLPELSAAELKIYLYLQVRDPFGDRELAIDTAVLAEHLGYTRRTIQRALIALSEYDLIDWQVVKSKIKTKSAIKLSPLFPTESDQNVAEPSGKAMKSAIKMSPKRSKCRKQPLETVHSNDSGTPQTLLDNIIKIRSDRSHEFEKENSELIAQTLPNAIATKIDTKSDREEKGIETSKKVINPIEGDPARRKLEDFILKSLNLELSSEARKHYFAKLSPENWSTWQAKFKPNTCQPVEYRNPIAENPWMQQTAIEIAIRCGDIDEAKYRIDILAKIDFARANNLREKHKAILF